MNKNDIMELLDIYKDLNGENCSCSLESMDKINDMMEKIYLMDDIPKLNRWLGFIQGVLWKEGVYTVDELRAQVTKIVENNQRKFGESLTTQPGDKWCMCTKEELGCVARDMKATCGNCGGVDAYGGDKNRPDHLKKDEID